MDTLENIPLIDLRGTALDRRTLRSRLPRATAEQNAPLEAVRPLLDDIRDRGRAAVADAAARFDGATSGRFRVPAAALSEAVETLDPAVRLGLEEAIRRVRTVSAAEVPAPRTTSVADGASITTRHLPADRVGLYVPGGLAVYPSSVVMNTVPAQEAGVRSIAIASPPQSATGLPHPTVLAAAHLLGVDEVWAIGGAQAIGAFAFGFADLDGELGTEESLEPVDIITGPGNAYVATAKALVREHVGIDAVAGPTEIIVLADAAADPVFIAADLISQAEHDPLAAAVLVTESSSLAQAVDSHLGARTAAAEHSERIRTSLAGPQSGIVLVDSLDAGIAVVNAYAGEHVELHVADAQDVAGRIVNGGAVFVGAHTPVALGDYIAGSNHVLPTMGTAAFGDCLSVHAFLRVSQVVDYTRDALAEVADHITALASAERLPAHGESISVRFADEAREA
ncbi:histidinol dehydrogenase [Brevibacterium jeotgali]|uniref:Histidinol dehydrogenase n=1 Tax=Brevibacterium jeotgali TaxID=1262550 RepID=A0A2H1L6N5_9MICO|nr:histidinol dehydrogenase [Brevibacterium jeotgali]TWC02664.1 histidinol dehydrogenase [Brevibacterium jeotgali]SMY12574.1 histidinol dehydrogenase [Brevibacterium jeotgali]